MTGVRTVAVVDIGKTNAKVVLVDMASMAEIAADRVGNTVAQSGPYPHFDERLLFTFMVDALANLRRTAVPDAIVVTTHGASGALLAADGGLALPIIDYEYDGPDTLAAAYDAARPAFAETGSPRLPGGLNLGAQIFWQARAFPEAFARVAQILTYPQYWAYRLTGATATEPTSLGAHTDLWNPHRGDFSSLPEQQDWRRLMAPVRRADAPLGALRPDLATLLKLPESTPVFCGIHDSNASLYPHLRARQAPFAVVSTGTWVIVMAVGGVVKALDPARDTLINVNALGNPVPSARFMGGREFSLLLGDAPCAATDGDIARVLAGPVLLTPSVERGSGPFQGRPSSWLPAEPTSPGERFAVVSFYLAMMTATCLDLAGAQGEVIVEGPFGANACFTRMLATATGRNVLVSSGTTGTSIGAAMLCGGMAVGRTHDAVVAPEPGWSHYARKWTEAVG